LPYAVWLLFVALAGWVAGEIVGGEEYGRVTDVLLGMVGAFLVRFAVEISRIPLNDVYLLLFSVWGAAVLPGTFRLLRRDRASLKAKYDRATPSLH